MAELVLHHYEISLFSAKIRAMLGYCELPWGSALTPPMPPRPLVDRLAGGYRRIPVAQVGADIFCDSRLIADEIAQLAGRPELSLARVDTAQRELVERAELEVFFACVRRAAGWPLMRRVLRDYGPTALFKLLRDRAGMARSINEPRLRVNPSANAVEAYLDDLEALLSGDFLFGDRPTIADFSAWHCLWFVTRVGGRELLANHPRTQIWAANMTAFDSGARRELTPETVLSQARDAEPRELPGDAGQDALLGETVAIAPADYAPEPVHGTLVASLADRFILRRETPDAGTVHVHFPRERFSLDRG